MQADDDLHDGVSAAAAADERRQARRQLVDDRVRGAGGRQAQQHVRRDARRTRRRRAQHRADAAARRSGDRGGTAAHRQHDAGNGHRDRRRRGHRIDDDDAGRRGRGQLRQRRGAQRRIDHDQDRRQRGRRVFVDVRRQLRDAHLRGGDAGDHLGLHLFAAAIGGRAARWQDRDDRPLELDRIEAAVRRPIAAPAAHEDAGDAVRERRRRFADLQVGAGGERTSQARRQARAELRPGAAGREQDQQRRDPLDRGVQGRAVGQVEGRRAEAGALAGQHLVRAGAAQAGGDLVVEVPFRHHDGEYGHARRVGRASSLRQREQRRTGWGAVVEVDGNEQIRQRTPRNRNHACAGRAVSIDTMIHG